MPARMSVHFIGPTQIEPPPAEAHNPKIPCIILFSQTKLECGAKMIIIRDYQECDAGRVGQLIADTYCEFNLSFAPAKERGAFLGPFQHAGSPEKAHQEAIARVIRASMVFVAE